eukprot:s3615_g2.t1
MQLRDPGGLPADDPVARRCCQVQEPTPIATSQAHRVSSVMPTALRALDEEDTILVKESEMDIYTFPRVVLCKDRREHIFIISYRGRQPRLFRASTRLCTCDLPRLCTCDSPRLCTYDVVVYFVVTLQVTYHGCRGRKKWAYWVHFFAILACEMVARRQLWVAADHEDDEPMIPWPEHDPSLVPFVDQCTLPQALV